jgi:Flp pilus assembly protein TadG
MRLRRSRSAQALVMVTFALFAIVGLIGLAVDFGWMYFLEKNMQSAADAASLAAVRYAMERATSFADYDCTGSVTGCLATPTSCASIASGNLYSACLYAAANGFNHTTTGVTVRVQASDAVTAPTVIDDPGCAQPVDHPPTTGCVNTFYWVTVRVAQQVPQLFSAITGNMTGLVAARATAAIAESTVLGSLILINRENDPTGDARTLSTNLSVEGTGSVTVPGGIILASSSATRDHEAGRIQGASGRVVSPFTNIRDTGSYSSTRPDQWQNPPVNSPDSSSYWDPMWQKGGQPPINSDATLPFRPVDNGDLSRYCTDGICQPGIYYATESCRTECEGYKATGAPLRIPNNSTIRFQGVSPGFGAFGDWYFVGGLSVGPGTSLAMDPGRYAFLGVANTSKPVLEINNSVTISGGVSENSDAGRLLITSDWRPNGGYPGISQIWAQFMSTQQNAARANWAMNGLGFGKTVITAGNTEASRIDLFGLRKDDADVIAAGLNQFTPAVYWQDQRNSYVRYTDTGIVDTTCGSINSPCLNSPAPNPSDTPELLIQASPFANWGGMIYQPRGAWTRVQATGDDTGPLMIVTGAMRLQGGGNLTLTGPSTPLTIYTVALVE